MADHVWVKYTRTQVDILPSFGEEAFTAYTDPERVKQAEDDALFGCANCSEPLNDLTVNTPCEGANHDEAPTA